MLVHACVEEKGCKKIEIHNEERERGRKEYVRKEDESKKQRERGRERRELRDKERLKERERESCFVDHLNQSIKLVEHEV